MFNCAEYILYKICEQILKEGFPIKVANDVICLILDGKEFHSTGAAMYCYHAVTSHCAAEGLRLPYECSKSLKLFK